jgi:hypothetical protein
LTRRLYMTFFVSNHGQSPKLHTHNIMFFSHNFISKRYIHLAEYVASRCQVNNIIIIPC